MNFVAVKKYGYAYELREIVDDWINNGRIYDDEYTRVCAILDNDVNIYYKMERMGDKTIRLTVDSED